MLWIGARKPKPTDRDLVDHHMRGVLPPGVPPSYRNIISAGFVGSGKKRTIVAELEMFDGERAVVEVFSWGKHDGRPCSGHRWLAWSGAPCFFEDGAWKRDVDGAVEDAVMQAVKESAS